MQVLRNFAAAALLFLAHVPTGTSAFVVHSKKTTSSSASNNVLRAQKEATFGMGCFWKPAEDLLKVDGVIDTTAGYTGHPEAKEDPTYDKVCFSRDWVEGVRVIYDDNKISYDELLDAFFDAQEPRTGSRQYASFIFPHDDEQTEIAQTWLQEGTEAKRVRDDGVPVSFTRIEPLSPFYAAEGYHQRYWAKFRPRVAAVLAFVALNLAPLNNSGFLTPDVISTIHTISDLSLKAIGAYVLLERVIDAKVVKL